MFAAIFDTCVLWPSLKRDFLLSMAVEGLYRPLWSEAILEELRRNEALKLYRRGGLDEAAAAARAESLVYKMRTSFDDALVTGWEGLEGTYGLPDPGDEHVVAAAVVGGAGVIVTDNVKDFPATHLPAHLHVLEAKDFAADTADVDPARAARAIHELSIRRSHPRKEPLLWLAILVERYGMVEVGDILEPVLKDMLGTTPDPR